MADRPHLALICPAIADRFNTTPGLTPPSSRTHRFASLPHGPVAMSIEDLLASATQPSRSQPTDEMADPSFQDFLRTMSENPELAAKVLSGLPADPLAQPDEHPKAFEVVPEPGFVVKTLNQTEVGDWAAGLKVFINLCHSEQIPPPPLASDEEIRRALNAEDNTAFRVPLSLSGPKAEKDKSGRACLVFDACINTQPFLKCMADEDFKLFLVELSMEWVEEKHRLDLSREFTLPKLKTKGQLSKHIIRRTQRPQISEINPVLTSATAQRLRGSPAATASSSSQALRRLKEPKHNLVVKGSDVIATIELPDLTSTRSCTVDIESDRLLFHSPERYDLDLRLPRAIDTELGEAVFNRETRVLTITMTSV
ncbi:pre-RNA processing PIH1/Nop17-domain-containing protein [Polychytrium aggregatum]|uniref:pre-RNA processing PIH1/Nop17-domain-containing protein n=1 Tax=Polychytrium aggregatum TaxID=110093 RepID=UPI0022FEA69E|nr:pre-RNA processing PIH1/Nop17-domain-containing protein [Polychytrium aggregatum]KAI9203803.1 pre-RNA processing PIH1/Nop17-domain-containing protein [Polychytrium aggregatum]